MSFELFLATRMRQNAQNESSVSSRIIKIGVFAIALGMVMMLIALGTTLGLQNAIREKTISFSSHLKIAPFENNDSALSVRPIITSDVLLPDSVLEDIASVYPVINMGGLLKSKSEFEGVIFKGVDGDYPKHKIQSFLLEGHFPKFDSMPSNEVLLSKTLSDRLSLSTGDRVTAYFQNSRKSNLPLTRYFTVAGIYETGFPDFDATYIWGDLRQVQRLKNWEKEQVGGYEVFLKEENSLQEMSEKIYNLLPSEIDVQTIEQLYQGVFEWIALFDFNTLIIILIMVVVGTLNMATALLVLILERSRMVGVLKSFGATAVSIQKIFLWNAVYIIFKGMIIGNGIGLLLLYLQSRTGFVQLDPATYFVREVPVSLGIFPILLLNVFVLFSCTFLLWFPSLVIGKIDPVKALRFR